MVRVNNYNGINQFYRMGKFYSRVTHNEKLTHLSKKKFVFII